GGCASGEMGFPTEQFPPPQAPVRRTRQELQHLGMRNLAHVRRASTGISALRSAAEPTRCGVNEDRQAYQSSFFTTRSESIATLLPLNDTNFVSCTPYGHFPL